MAHAMDDLIHMDLIAHGWWLHDRVEMGASGTPRRFTVVEGPGAAPQTLDPYLVRRLTEKMAP